MSMDSIVNPEVMAYLRGVLKYMQGGECQNIFQGLQWGERG